MFLIKWSSELYQVLEEVCNVLNKVVFLNYTRFWRRYVMFFITDLIRVMSFITALYFLEVLGYL